VDDPDDGTYSRPPNLEDVARIGRALNEAQARYVLIGGFAVIIHGSGRTTKDIDFWVDPSPENVARIKLALKFLPDNAAEDLELGDVVRVADEVVVDLLAGACGVSYDDAVSRAEHRNVGGTQILVASKETLIRTKQTIRPNDHMDCEYLARGESRRKRESLRRTGAFEPRVRGPAAATTAYVGDCIYNSILCLWKRALGAFGCSSTRNVVAQGKDLGDDFAFEAVMPLVIEVKRFDYEDFRLSDHVPRIGLTSDSLLPISASPS
jgi:hypothetical protein